MQIFITEKSIDGLLSCVYKAYTEKTFPEIVADNNIQLPIGARLTTVEEDHAHASRVLTALVNYAGRDIVYSLKTVLRHYSNDALTVAFKYVCKVLDEKQDISLMLSEPTVINFNDLTHQVLAEVHRYKGFLRFIETAQGILYGFYEPENDITEFITPHFVRRLGKNPFIIHDLKRGVIALHNDNVTKYVNNSGQLFIELSENEKAINDLWKKYFNTVTIKERENRKLQNAWVPKKMRKHMSEFRS